MRVLIIRHTDQPAVNIVDNISTYSRHECKIQGRDNFNFDADVVFYYNVNDVLQPGIYKVLRESNQPICVGIQSWRLFFEEGWLDKIKLLNIIGVCSPINKLLKKAIKKINTNCYAITPFTADKRLFKETKKINVNEKLKVGYVGTFRADKRYNDIVKPAFSKFKNEIELILIGRVSGKRMSIDKMHEAYNNMDCLVVGSKYESGPMPPMEAALCGRPTITTRCGLMEDVFDATTSIFINDVNGLEDAIDMFVKNKELCYDMGQKSRERVANSWTWENLIKLQDSFFDEVYKWLKK